MIKSKKDLAEYLLMDKKALGIVDEKKHPKLWGGGDDIWKFEILLRKCEFYKNNYYGINKLLFRLHKIRFNKLSYKLGYTIPLNVIDSGLALPHYGTIVINSKSKIGKNCRIHVGVNIGANGGSNAAPRIGNDVYIGPGAKIIGNITIADGVIIGANAVVCKNIDFPNTVWAGVPAKLLKKRC